jgi:hypothetical protein
VAYRRVDHHIDASVLAIYAEAPKVSNRAMPGNLSAAVNPTWTTSGSNGTDKATTIAVFRVVSQGQSGSVGVLLRSRIQRRAASMAVAAKRQCWTLGPQYLSGGPGGTLVTLRPNPTRSRADAAVCGRRPFAPAPAVLLLQTACLQ